MNTDQKWPSCKDCNTNMEVKEKKTLSNKVYSVLFACPKCGKGAVRHGEKWRERLVNTKVKQHKCSRDKCQFCEAIEQYKDEKPTCTECGKNNTEINDAIVRSDGFDLIGYCYDCGEPFFVRDEECIGCYYWRDGCKFRFFKNIAGHKCTRDGGPLDAEK